MREMEIMTMDKAEARGYRCYSVCPRLLLLLIDVTKSLAKLARRPFYYHVDRFYLNRDQ